MRYLNSLKNIALTAIVMLSSAFAEQPIGIIGGQQNPNAGPAYAALISSSGTATPIPGLPSNGFIASVAINGLGQALIGGEDTPNAGPVYAAFVSPSGILTPISGLPSNGLINAVGINDFGQGIIGGQLNNFGGPAYAALVSPSGTLTPISTSITVNGLIGGVAINNSGRGLIGGRNATTLAAYGAIVSPSGIATEITGLPSIGASNAVALNASNKGIIGGSDTSGPTAPFAAFISPSGTATPISGLPSNTVIIAVAINSSDHGIIGGGRAPVFVPTYAALVSPDGIATTIAGLPPLSVILAVAINDVGQGIIGGQLNSLTGPAYAALVSPSGTSTPISLNLSANSRINSVAINDFGQGLIGGQDNTTLASYAAIVSPDGIATPIALGFNGIIDTVALSLLTQIPTGSLSGNNLRFANYINENAPQDAFYFVPSVLDGTLSQALESAAPTRNAFSVYTASNNLFYLTTSLSNHIRNRSRYLRTTVESSMMEVAAVSEELPSEELMVSASDDLTASLCERKPKKRCEVPVVKPCECPEEKNTSIWFEALGAFAYQQAQHQTPGFHPSTGGAILAFDGKTCEHTRMGLGVSYLYTHIEEKKKAGHSNINQEDLFVYGSWENKNFYLDLSVLGGLFQVDQVRKIHMTGFEFKSTSHPHGWQLLPHAELGYHYTTSCGVELTFNPFVMVDWANAWQHSYHEKGSGPFNAGQKSHHSSLLRTEASLRLYETFVFDTWDLVLQEKAGYVNVHSFGAGRVNAFLVGSPGSFTVSTLTDDQNLGVAEFAMIFAPHESSLTSTLFYQGEFGSKYQSHQVALELAWNF